MYIKMVSNQALSLGEASGLRTKDKVATLSEEAVRQAADRRR